MVNLKNKKKIALVLSGGGVKAAAFHVGVCIALREKGFRFIGGTREQVDENPLNQDPMAIKTYVGSSAGAFMAAILASGHSLEDIVHSFQMGSGLLIRKPKEKSKLKPINYFDIFSANKPTIDSVYKTFFKKHAVSSWGIESALKNNFKVNGFFTTNSLERYLRKYVLPTNSFNELGVEFFSVATYLNHSRKAIFGQLNSNKKNPEAYYINDVSISDAVAASMSLPPVFAPYPIKMSDGDTVYFFDGEIRETLSTHVAKEFGADLVISSYSIQPYEFTKEVGSLSEYGLPLILNQALYQVVQQKIARAVEARESINSIIKIISGYFKEHNLPKESADALIEIICRKINHRKDVDYIYIHPRGQNYEMFFVDHFSLSPQILSRIVKEGFKSAIGVLRSYSI